MGFECDMDFNSDLISMVAKLLKGFQHYDYCFKQDG
jgi:hypothetical protein